MHCCLRPPHGICAQVCGTTRLVIWQMTRSQNLFNVRRQNKAQLLFLGFSLSILTTSDVAPTQATNKESNLPGKWGKGPRPAEVRLKLKGLPCSCHPHWLARLLYHILSSDMSTKMSLQLKAAFSVTLPQSNLFQQLNRKWALGLSLSDTLLGSVCVRSPAPPKSKWKLFLICSQL